MINKKSNVWWLEKGVIVVFFLFYVIVFLAKLFHVYYLSKVLIPLFILLIALYSLKYTKKFPHGTLISFALFFAFVGDVIINLTSIPYLAILPFALAHMCLIGYYFAQKRMTRSDIIILIPILLMSSIFFYVVQNDIQDSVLKIIFFLYILILNLMLWRALCLWGVPAVKDQLLKIVIGSVLFFITDMLVGVYIIYGFEWCIIGVWLIYPVALGLLSILHKQTLITRNKIFF
jgi:hypothetical protein